MAALVIQIKHANEYLEQQPVSWQFIQLQMYALYFMTGRLSVPKN